MQYMRIEGKCEWAHVQQPNTKWVKPHGEYSIDVIVPADKAAVLCEQLDELAKKKLDEVVKEAKPEKQKQLKDALSIVQTGKKYYDKNGDHDGSMVFKAKRAAVITSKSGQEYTQNIAVMDSKKTPLPKTVMVGNESDVKIVVEPYPYLMQSNKTVGVSLRLHAVQVINLVEPANKGASALLDEEDGYIAQAVAKDDISEMLDDSYSTPSTDTEDEGDF